MKLLVVSDFHGSEAALEKIGEKVSDADLVLSVGDFTMFSDQLVPVLEKMDSWGKTVLLIHGNHEDEVDVRSFCSTSKNLKFIHKNYFVHKDFGFFGFGGLGFSRESVEAEIALRAAAKNLENKRLIMVVHQPPFGVKVDFLDWFGHVGNESFTKVIHDLQPEFCFCGHLHETFDVEDNIGKTRIVNTNPHGVFFDL